MRNKNCKNISLLDKFIDGIPDQKDLLFYEGIRRDLENLLNTRASNLSWPEAWRELNTSLLTYGMADFVNKDLTSVNAKNKFCKALENIILKFEPRFKSVKVQLMQSDEKPAKTLRLSIEGLLYAEPTPEPVFFDSILQPATQSFFIQESS